MNFLKHFSLFLSYNLNNDAYGTFSLVENRTVIKLSSYSLLGVDSIMQQAFIDT